MSGTETPDMDAPIQKSRQKPTRSESHDVIGISYHKNAPRIPTQWRPSFHFLAPAGWMNDPCGLGYDPATDLYHLSFQWNPHGNDWGNMSWGHATSPDLVSWTTYKDPILTPTADYDCRGVFTGCLRSTDISGNAGSLTAIYTSVSNLPLHYTLPYVTGSESLSIAISEDGGMTWERQDCNPILTGPPGQFNVTGWRDPCITTWAEGPLSKGSPLTLYGFISGGVVGQTPTAFVYTVDPNDLRKWEFLGPLVDVGLNLRPSRWSGDFGANWEVANMMTLSDGNVYRDFIILGAEGCLPSEDAIKNGVREAGSKREPRGQLWMSVKASEKQNSNSTDEALASYAFSGFFDHGCYYAANSFWDVQASQQIVFGWITEEDLSDSLRHRQGFSGLTSLPRVVELMTLNNVKKARNSSLSSITSIEVIPDAHGTGNFTVHTMKISPDSRLSRLREGAQKSQLVDIPLSTTAKVMTALQSTKWEIKAEFSVGQSCTRVGIKIPHTSDSQDQKCTTLSWTPDSETFTIDRPHLDNTEVNQGFETAPHTLFTFLDEQGQEIEETLRVRAFFDASVLEVFVNDRTVISTRIYYPEDHCFGPIFFAEADTAEKGAQPAAVLMKADVWDGIGV
ncbi:hypothetical protein PENARI_c003G02913 [Penicillium arizonense]|uniref:Glycosyl hydrolase family 32 N-terminal domain-containing protein n=1 Tax=Penicillium arizonense TaxID=1835702 RepID=A0A1F5LSY5_PENAI|nr:hypothetical protein PENARI_c003G02913 [Penicillium arizonense]OGE56322.1 hypothetical protein PENARI_c003G02913 [Penicillium arizonense]